jgi:hypothetical protein
VTFEFDAYDLYQAAQVALAQGEEERAEIMEGFAATLAEIRALPETH